MLAAATVSVGDLGRVVAVAAWNGSVRDWFLLGSRPLEDKGKGLLLCRGLGSG